MLIEHFQVPVTHLLQTHLEWQVNRKAAVVHAAHAYGTMYVASLDVQTAFDVANLGIVADISRQTGDAWVDYCEVAAQHIQEWPEAQLQQRAQKKLRQRSCKIETICLLSCDTYCKMCLLPYVMRFAVCSGCEGV